MEIQYVVPADRDDLLDLRTRAFGPVTAAERERILPSLRQELAAERVLGVYDGARLIASGRYYPMEQWWHGAAVPMGGVASVYVAPEERGRGVGVRLATALVELMAERGIPLSVLYPATVPVYRTVGYELAGDCHWFVFDADAVRKVAGEPTKVRRAGPGDAAEIVAVVRGVHAAARDAGPVDRGEEHLRWSLEDPDVFAYLADDGFLSYHWNDDLDEFVVKHIVAGSAETARALWAIVGSGSSVVRSVRARISPHDPIFWLLRDVATRRMWHEKWMLRLIDAPAAVAARGFPPGVSAEVSLVVDDPLRPANAGSWRLTVADGRGTLERAAEDPEAVRADVRGLAALYAGIPAGTLRRAGLLVGGDTAALDAAFAAASFMVDQF